MESSSSGSSRRARTSTNGSSVPSCTVDGCTADLRNCRDYHRRHKVCERHSKTSVVFVKGHEQRFCQQCSRFHSLVEFDEGKRSCRKRLEGHNRRRRKPQRDSVSVNVQATTGTRYIHFGASQILSAYETSEPLSDSNRALSLLSSPLAESPMARQESNPRAQTSMSSLNYSCTGVETEPVGSVFGSDGLFTTGSQPTLSFSWE